MKIAVRLLTLALCLFASLQMIVIDSLRTDVAEMERGDVIFWAKLKPFLFRCGFTLNNGYLQAPAGVEEKPEIKVSEN